MWSAQIARTERHGDSLSIVVVYTDNQGNEFSQVLTTSSAQGDTWLSDQITAKLNQLSDLDNFQAIVDADSLLTSTISIDGGTLVATPIVETPIIDQASLGTA